MSHPISKTIKCNNAVVYIPTSKSGLSYILNVYFKKFRHLIVSRVLHDQKLEVFIVMKEGRSFKAVGGSAGSLHTIGHSRWSTREDTDLGKEDVLFLEVVEEGIEVRTTKVGDGTKTSEQALAR